MILVDTGVWYEATVGDGELADRCRALIDERADRLVTTDAILAELWLLLAARGHQHLATPTCTDVAFSTEVLAIETGEREGALTVLRDWQDQPFTYTDALSFAVMERRGITTALSLDAHYRVYRFGAGRRGAFEVLPA